jgi:hypothetical protein
MGKLSDLWGELKTVKSESEKTEIKKKINDIEAWCIEKGFGGIKEQTDWTKKTFKKKKNSYGSDSSFTEAAGFVTVGNLILPKHQFCPKCKLYKDNGLIWSSEGIIHD